MNAKTTIAADRTDWAAVRGNVIGTEQVSMEKQVSGLNTLWLIECLRTYHPQVDIHRLVADTSIKGPFFIRNRQTNHLEPVAVSHLECVDYWFSNIFMMAFYCTIEEHCADPDFAYKCGSTFYKTQSRLKIAVGVPLIGPYRLIKKIVSENDKYNRTKAVVIRSLTKGCVVIRLTHKPDIIMKAFAVNWHLGLFESYAGLAGVTNPRARATCIEKGPQRYGDTGRAIYDFEITFKDPGLLHRIWNRTLYALPSVRELIDGAEQIQARHNEEILYRDNIITERTEALVKVNETMRVEITERKRAEEVLLQIQVELQRYITAIDDIGLGMCVIDADYRLRMMNKTMVAWFGDDPEGICHRVIMGQGNPCPHCRLRDVVKQARKVRYQPTMADGRRFDIVATPLSNTDGTISKMIIIRDITEQQQQEERRLEITRQREELKKLASLKNMAGAIAHRFNNAMVSVQGNLELLTLLLPGESKKHRMASQAFQAAKGASQIGSMMLSYVGQNPLTRRKVSLLKVVREAVIAAKHLPSKIDLQIVPSNRTLYCSIDQQQLKEVIENILINAVESFENDSGTIEITFGIDYFTTKDFPIFFQENNLENGMYSFCQIKDSGQGICAEDLPKVFEPFYTTKFFGRGLGLALSAGIMQTHDGALTFESILGRGTTVRIVLPAHESSVQQMINQGIVKAPVTKLSGNILLVDDDAIVLEVGKKILTNLGFTVATAVNGKEAVDKVKSRDVHYCGIVMDISMPEMDGIEAMQSIRKIDSTIPILLSSGYSESDFIFNKDQGSQPNGFLPKPYNISDLQSNIEKILSSCPASSHPTKRAKDLAESD